MVCTCNNPFDIYSSITNEPVAMTRAKRHLVSIPLLKKKQRSTNRTRTHQCVVGDSSTVQHGSPFLKKWMNWLENNADVRYAGLE